MEEQLKCRCINFDGTCHNIDGICVSSNKANPNEQDDPDLIDAVIAARNRIIQETMSEEKINSADGRILACQAVDHTKYIVASGRTAFIDGYEAGYNKAKSQIEKLEKELETGRGIVLKLLEECENRKKENQGLRELTEKLKDYVEFHDGEKYSWVDQISLVLLAEQALKK